jgi:LemA protein
MSIGTTILLVVIVVIVLWIAGTFNALVSLRNRVRNAMAQIDVQLKRRYDLIPNLVETAKGYLAHERQTLDAVVAARGSASAARARVAANPGDQGAVKQLAADDAALTGALGRLFALAEAYPDLKSNVNMMQLSEELTTTENKVSFARQAYNDAAMHYNTRVESFPANLIAGVFQFPPAELWQLEAAAEERQVVKVSFS